MTETAGRLMVIEPPYGSITVAVLASLQCANMAQNMLRLGVGDAVALKSWADPAGTWECLVL